MNLDNKPLITCNQSSNTLSENEINTLLNELNNWSLTAENGIKKISRCFAFNNYVSAQKFANTIAALAEQENHHPRICIEWGKATVSWWTHSIKGLFINDFIMAARCDRIFNELA